MDEKDIETGLETIDDRIDRITRAMEEHISVRQAEDEFWKPSLKNVLTGVLAAIIWLYFDL